METVSAVMDRAKYRSNKYTNLRCDRFSDLGVRWLDMDNAHSRSGWYAKIDGKDLLLSDNAVKTASRQIMQKNIGYWHQFPDKNAFPKTMTHILDGNNRNRNGLLVRHDGLKVRAILPSNYRIKDAHELLGDFLESIEENAGKVNGICASENSSGDIHSYRVVVGDNIIPKVNNEYGQYLMFSFLTSETGALHTSIAAGLYRTICTNSAIRKQLQATWNHFHDPQSMYERTSENIRMTSYYKPQYKKIFQELLNAKLPISAQELLGMLKDKKEISSEHYDAALIYADTPTEDGRPVETHYDMFNALTRSAQDIPHVHRRHMAEATAMDIFTRAGGVLACAN